MNYKTTYNINYKKVLTNITKYIINCIRNSITIQYIFKPLQKSISFTTVKCKDYTKCNTKPVASIPQTIITLFPEIVSFAFRQQSIKERSTTITLNFNDLVICLGEQNKYRHQMMQHNLVLISACLHLKSSKFTTVLLFIILLLLLSKTTLHIQPFH